MQSRRMSFGEACLSTALGFVINMIGQWLIFPLFDIRIGLGKNLGIALAFTGVSVARAFAVRRIFNRIGP